MMEVKKRFYFKKRPGMWFDIAVMMFFLVIILTPMALIVRKSFSIRGIQNYVAVFETGLLTNVKNSMMIAGGTVAIVLCVICPAAYAFSKFSFKGFKMLYYVSILGMMVPSVVMLVPIMLLGKELNLMNNLAGVIFPLSAIIAPFMLLILKNSIDDHPTEIYEAAFVDGCSKFRILFSVVVPMSKPTLLVITLFAFMDSWNEFFLPLALLRTPNMMTVTVIPMRFYEEFGADQPKIFAASVLIVLPVVLLYLLVQQYFEAGFTTGAVKG